MINWSEVVNSDQSEEECLLLHSNKRLLLKLLIFLQDNPILWDNLNEDGSDLIAIEDYLEDLQGRLSIDLL